MVEKHQTDGTSASISSVKAHEAGDQHVVFDNEKIAVENSHTYDLEENGRTIHGAKRGLNARHIQMISLGGAIG